jgi:dTDP-4-dehydrorhamnose 3,5-epimerase
VKITRTEIPEVVILEPEVFEDERGSFFESYNRRELGVLAGIDFDFVQDNISTSKKNVVRGLHYQLRRPQGKLVRAMRGEVFDVAADIRRASPTFGRWVGFTLSASNRRMAWIPQGFAHGFLALSDTAEILYKATDYWNAMDERTILWSDKDLAIVWPLTGVPILSRKDREGTVLRDAELL